jgi:threonine aldolase
MSKAGFDTTAQFASDNNGAICPEAFAALGEANHGHAAAYGDDDWSQAAVRAIRDVFETDCEVFLVFTGTAANSLGLASICRSTDAIVCHAMAHINVDECGAPEFMSGGAKLLTIDLPQATELGTVYTPAEIKALSEVAHARGMKVQLDGARFANALVHLGCSPADTTWRAGVDVLSFGGTKNGMPFGEAVVFFDRALADEFLRRRKQAGQLSSKMRYLAAPWLGMLKDGAWLRHAGHANAMAARLAEGLARVPGARLLAPVQANGVFVDLPAAVVAGLRERGWRFYTFIGETGCRFMCAWDTPVESVDRMVRDVGELAGARAR